MIAAVIAAAVESLGLVDEAVQVKDHI